ncbi:MAG TPA: hypothetical protein VN612_16225 [Acidobacteriaceae bacterium]|nr:hypothetical protein [Acidobacteriaceae bacterium]
MTDMHDLLIIGVPLVVIIAGILFNRGDAKELRAELKDLRAEMAGSFNKMESRLDRIDADLRQFYHLSGKLEGRIDTLEKRGA